MMPHIQDVPQNGPDATPLPIAIGTAFLGKYKIERILGRGGMGVVVAARHKALRQLVAIKFLVPEITSNPEATSRFLKEARAAAAIKSEHVVSVYDVDQLPDGQPFMIMEYIEGRELKAVLRDAPLSVDDVITYMLQVCDAVGEAHRAGIVHRDLKPANLMLTKRSNGSPCVKVLDFGIAKMADPDQTSKTGKCIIGSLKYMAPEQLFTPHLVDARADIWALGIVAYELLTAKTPFAGYTEMDIVTNINHANPPPPSMWRTDVSPAVEAVIFNCLRKNRDERYQSVDALMEALRDLRSPADIAPTTIRSPTLVPPQQAPGSAMIVTTDDDKMRHGFGLTNPMPKPGHRRSWMAVMVGAVVPIAAIGAFYFMLDQSAPAPTVTAASAMTEQLGVNDAPSASSSAVIPYVAPEASRVEVKNTVGEIPRKAPTSSKPVAPAPTVSSMKTTPAMPTQSPLNSTPTTSPSGRSGRHID